MLSRGFKDQIHDVFRTLNTEVQVILLSATMPSDVLEVTSCFMRKPIRILVKKEELTLEGALIYSSFSYLPIKVFSDVVLGMVCVNLTHGSLNCFSRY